MAGIVGRLFREFAVVVTCAGPGVGLHLADADADDVLAVPEACEEKENRMAVSTMRWRRFFEWMVERL